MGNRHDLQTMRQHDGAYRNMLDVPRVRRQHWLWEDHVAAQIRAEHINEAEQRIARVYQLVAGADSNDKVLMAARTDPDGFLKFAQYHSEILFKQYLPDIDPRQEPAIMTMMRHFFAVGAVAQRLSEGNRDD